MRLRGHLDGSISSGVGCPSIPDPVGVLAHRHAPGPHPEILQPGELAAMLGQDVGRCAALPISVEQRAAALGGGVVALDGRHAVTFGSRAMSATLAPPAARPG
ncbi:hypothetical protein A3862_27355 [Methylobacterium sp. XJLW]|nr:hypothetical protein A3862_27355 [Methylobacterium sp. XJLW]